MSEADEVTIWRAGRQKTGTVLRDAGYSVVRHWASTPGGLRGPAAEPGMWVKTRRNAQVHVQKPETRPRADGGSRCSAPA